MFSAYCSALRDDPNTSETKKAQLLRDYNAEVRRVLSEQRVRVRVKRPPPSPPHQPIQKEPLQSSRARQDVGISAERQQTLRQLEETYASVLQAKSSRPSDPSAQESLDKAKHQLVEEYNSQAMYIYRRQELNRAIEMWDRVLELDPNNEEAKQYRAKAVELKKRVERLIQ